MALKDAESEVAALRLVARDLYGRSSVLQPLWGVCPVHTRWPRVWEARGSWADYYSGEVEDLHAGQGQLRRTWHERTTIVQMLQAEDGGLVVGKPRKLSPLFRGSYGDGATPAPADKRLEV